MTPTKKNNNRYDLSDKVIHFFRDVDTCSEDAPIVPEHWGYSAIPEDFKISALFSLRHCIRQGRIWATWAWRGEKRTIYGPRPAVCFTEMPIPAFIETSCARAKRNEAIASYALVFSKLALYNVGARPVIYGLSTFAVPDTDRRSGERFFPNTVMPTAEQYRYVAYNPSSERLDWTHEREWRWPLDEAPWCNLNDFPPEDSDSIPGLSIDAQCMRGMGVIVKSDNEAQSIIHDILTKVDRGDISKSHFEFVLAHENIPNWYDIINKNEIESILHNNMIELEEYFDINSDKSMTFVEDLSRMAKEIENSTPDPEHQHPYDTGGCWLWLVENSHELVRALIQCNRVNVNKGGKYLVHFPEIRQDRPLQQKEEMITRLAKNIYQSYEVLGCYHSVLHSSDSDGIPNYNNYDYSKRSFFYNFS